MTTHRIQFTFEGEPGFTVECDEDTDVVSAAMREGYILLSQCRQGVCSTCKGVLVDGEYDELLPHSVHALSPYEEDEGYVLACRLEPRTDLVIDFDYPLGLIERLPVTAMQGDADR
jgi:methane monooxygenase component C